MKYERLTQKGKKWIESNHDEVEAYNRLCELEDKIERGELVENTVVTYVNMGRSGSKTLIDKALKFDALKKKIENGTLVELPCKIGDTLWEVHKSYIAPLDFIVDAIKIWYDGDISIEDRYNNHYFISEFGKTVFLTKAEAEEKLEELIDNE